MNIFVLDRDQKKCARYHADKHVVKMILESAQLLSTAVRLSGLDAGYKATHKNHPCALWTRASRANWLWLKDLARELNAEYRFRFRREQNHKSWDVIATLPEPPLPDVGLTPFAQAMPESYRHNNPVTAYRRYYLNEKKHLLNWSGNRCKPGWVRNGRGVNLNKGK